MTTYDAPDWEKIVHVLTGTGVSSDAPDWERVVVGPGGTPVGGGSLTATNEYQNDVGATDLVGGGTARLELAEVVVAGVYLAGMSLLVQDTSGSTNAVVLSIEHFDSSFPPLFFPAVTWVAANGYGGLTSFGVLQLQAHDSIAFAVASIGACTVGGGAGSSALGIQSSYSIALLAAS